jgi:outer membrane lipoprotein
LNIDRKNIMGRLSTLLAVYTLLFFFLGGVTACAPALSKKVREEAGEPVPFETLLKRTDGFKGRMVIVGGYILETINETDGSLITVLQAPLDSQNRPKSSDLSEGRFMVSTSDFLDPVVYSNERRITVGGKVIGSQERQLGNLTYAYPVIEAIEIHLWSKEGEYIGPYYPYYDPWYYPRYRRPHLYRYPYW